MVRVQSVFAKSGGDKVMRAIKDSGIKTICPACKQSQYLSEARVSEKDGETIYKCKDGCRTLVIVGNPEAKPMANRGFLLGNYVIRNATDLIIPQRTADVLIPACSAALKKRTDFDESGGSLISRLLGFRSRLVGRKSGKPEL
jgi:hypothetical protein